MKLLVTGATGFVGRHLVPRLTADHDVACLVRTPSPVADRVQPIIADLADPDFTSRLPTDIDVIVHLAQAYLPFPERAADLFTVNAASAQRLAEYGRRIGVARFVHASSGSVYRPGPTPLSEDAPTVPPAFHPATKLMAEMALAQYRPYFDVAILRLFAPYGPGQTDRLIPRMLESIREGAPVTLSRGGEPRINPIYVDDVVAIFSQAVADQGSYTVNVAGPRAVSIRDMAEIIGGLLGRAPVFVDRDADTPGDFVADTTLMHQRFDVGEMVSIEHGLESMIGIVTPPAH